MKAPLLPAFLLAAASAAAAQVLVDVQPDAGRKLAAGFDEQWAGRQAARLPCRVQRFQPQLDYGLRLWSGFGASVRATELGRQPNGRLAVAFRVVPLDRPAPAAYFYQNSPVPRPPEGAGIRKVQLNLGGGFLLGEGRYRVDWLLLHSSGRACRASWKLKAKGPGRRLAAGQVEAVDAALWHGFAPSGASGRRAAIFLHASPVRPRRYVARLSPWDRQVLLSTLSSVLRDGGFGSASVTVFDLQNRRLLFREADIDPRGLRRLARQLAQVDYSTVSLETLAQGPSPRPFLEELLTAGLKSPVPASAFVFIGSRWRGGPKLDGLSPALKEALPRSWFLAFSTPQTLAAPDSLSSLVRAVRGKVLSIFHPPDLASALREITAAQK